MQGWALEPLSNKSKGKETINETKTWLSQYIFQVGSSVSSLSCLPVALPAHPIASHDTTVHACPSRSPHIPSHHTTRLYMRVPPSVVTVLRDFFSSSSFRDIKIVTSVDIVRCRQHMPFVGSSSQALQEGATFSVAEWGQVFCLPASSELKTTDSVPRLVIDCTHTCLLDS